MPKKDELLRALKSTWLWDDSWGDTDSSPIDGRDKEISLLIYDIYGGEILRTPYREGWHFYNRIDGERLDLSSSEIETNTIFPAYMDIPSTAEEVHRFFDEADYLNLQGMFVRAFEGIVGLKTYQLEYSEY